MLKQNHEVDSPPTCFGKMFDGNSPECVGGHDPAFNNDNSRSANYNTPTRDTCDWVQSCAGRMQARLIPASNLVRPPIQPPATSPWQTKFNQPSPQQATQGWRPPTPYSPSQAHQPHPGAHLMSTHFGIPQYLTVREPQTGRNFGQRLFSETVRSMLKSIGHTFAHFFDVEIFDNRPPPGGGAPPSG